MGPAVGSDDWAIDQAVAEYRAYSAGERLCVGVDDVVADGEGTCAGAQGLCIGFAAPDGEVQYCGALEDLDHWTVCFVRDADEAVTPVAVGALAQVRERYAKFDTLGAEVENPRTFPPPAAIIGGVRRCFRAARGRFLVGVVQEGRRAVLLASIGERLAVVYLEGKSRAVLDIKMPLHLREVDVDRMLPHRLAPTRSAEEEAEPIVSSVEVRAHHNRIVYGLKVDGAGGPPISEVLWCCFMDLARRAKAPKERARGVRLKGKLSVDRVVRALYQLALTGRPDLDGLTGDLLQQIKDHVPDFEITPEAFADVLNLLEATGTCLVSRCPGGRIRHIHLEGLNDPRSAHHLRLCQETSTSHCYDAAANERPAANAPRSPSGAPGSSVTTGRSASSSDGGKSAEAPTPATVTTTSTSSAGSTSGSTRASESTSTSSGPIDSGLDGAAAPVGEGRTSDAAAGDPPAGGASPAPTSGTMADHTGPETTSGAAIRLSPPTGPLLLLLAARFAVAQVRSHAETDLRAERAAWETERRELLGEVEAAGRDHAELVALREQVALLTREIAGLRERVAAAASAEPEPLVEPRDERTASHSLMKMEPTVEDETSRAPPEPPEAQMALSEEAATSGDPGTESPPGEAAVLKRDEPPCRPESVKVHPQPPVEDRPQPDPTRLAALIPSSASPATVPDQPAPRGPHSTPSTASNSGPSREPAWARFAASLVLWLPVVASSRRTLGGLPVGPVHAGVDGQRDAEPDWFGRDFFTCATLATLSDLVVLGSLGPRGPPTAQR